MATTYSNWSDGWTPKDSSYVKHYRARLDTSVSTNSNDTYGVTVTVYVEIDSSVEAYYKGRCYATNYGVSTSGTVYTSFGGSKLVYAISTTYYWTKGTSAYTVAVTGGAWSDKKTWDGYWMETTQYFTVPARTAYTISYNANGGNSGTVESTTKYYNYSATVTTSTYRWLAADGTDAKSFKSWNTNSGGTGTTYLSGSTYPSGSNANATLYAQWQDVDPPTCSYTELKDFNERKNFIKTFSDIGLTVSDIQIKDNNRLPLTVTLTIGSKSETHTLYSVDESTEDVIWVTPNQSGVLNVTLTLTDSAPTTTSIDLGTVEVFDPTWTYAPTFNALKVKLPDTYSSGSTDIKVYAETYSGGTGTGTFNEISGTYYAVDNGDNTWSLPIVLGESYVDDPTSETPNASIKVSYRHTDTDEKESATAFYETTRNANFSTGISNTMFISGCEEPNYSSRVWWSQINNPLYFPDLNYVEVGSNDTEVMGLCKVGDYLGVVKQSKTTDTAIFLLYPTSFEDDTTYAVKQLSSGIGAYGKYTFNVLGDETLFLSPNGVMAIVPSEDNDHKVQNRSYFVDGKLLKEPKIKEAYSFVFDGKYYLAVNDHCYVLDGNQRNSWGNDKTNLVYECYYLDNVPATCFVKYNDELYFSNEYGLCKFKSDSDPDAYTDTFNLESSPVSAKWSTVIDDDGALNYYKTMQKKGNLISVFPNLPFRYEAMAITEADFNKDKKQYFTRDEDSNYVRCTSESVYDENTTYYIRKKTATKVYVRKDMNDPVEIERQFGESAEIPSELFVNKKFKKYKRLQFIVENNENEPFGIDSIIKQYTIGNYAKR